MSGCVFDGYWVAGGYQGRKLRWRGQSWLTHCPKLSRQHGLFRALTLPTALLGQQPGRGHSVLASLTLVLACCLLGSPFLVRLSFCSDARAFFRTAAAVRTYRRF
jgi:hypothetical protein